MKMLLVYKEIFIYTVKRPPCYYSLTMFDGTHIPDIYINWHRTVVVFGVYEHHGHLFVCKILKIYI